jgi:hypothetical protein
VRQRCDKSDKRRQNFAQKCTWNAFSTRHNMYLGIFLFKPLQWTLCKKFSSVVSCVVNAVQVLKWFQGLSSSPLLLVWGSACLCFVRSLPYTMIYREGTCFEDLHICQHI